MSMPTRSMNYVARAVAGVIIALSLAACVSPAAATSQPPDPTATTPAPATTAAAPPSAPARATIQPTATPLGANPCASPSNAETVSFVQARGIPIPPGAILVDQGNQASDGVSGSADFTLVGVCAKGVNPQGATAFYVERMPGAGWTRSAMVPAPSGPNQPCGDTTCWTQAAGPGSAVVVRLRNMVARGADTEFTLVIESVTNSN